MEGRDASAGSLGSSCSLVFFEDGDVLQVGKSLMIPRRNRPYRAEPCWFASQITRRASSRSTAMGTTRPWITAV